MTVDRSLHFCASNRAWALGLHDAFVRGVNEKLFPAFENIEAEADAFASQEYERIGNLPCGADGPDMSRVAEVATDRGVERHSDLTFVQGQLHALAVAGMYHLWERTLKRFLLRELDLTGLSASQRKKIEFAGFDALVEVLGELRFEMRGKAFFSQLENASLIANAFKHGEGSSFERLKGKVPEALRGPYNMNQQLYAPRAEDLWIDVETFSTLASAFADFWQTMPEHLVSHQIDS